MDNMALQFAAHPETYEFVVKNLTAEAAMSVLTERIDVFGRARLPTTLPVMGAFVVRDTGPSSGGTTTGTPGCGDGSRLERTCKLPRATRVVVMRRSVSCSTRRWQRSIRCDVAGASDGQAQGSGKTVASPAGRGDAPDDLARRRVSLWSAMVMTAPV